MSLILGRGNKSLRVKTFGSGDGSVLLGGYEISMKDFLIATEYVLTNTDLGRNDPRLKFTKMVKRLKEVEGWNPSKKRLK